MSLLGVLVRKICCRFFSREKAVSTEWRKNENDGRAFTVFRECLETLDALHERGIVAWILYAVGQLLYGRMYLR